jgi:glycosyltransferase involved in cell wall biosynthesis
MRVAMLLHKSVQFDSRVRREASALARAGHRVSVLELAPLPGGAAELEGFQRRSCLPPAWMRRRLPFHLYRVAFLLAFVRELVRLRPDVVHAHDAAMLAPGIVGARLTGALLVYDSHELATSVPYRERAWAWFVAGIERLVVPRCAAVVTVSDGIAERLRLRYRLSRTPTVVRNVTALRLGADSDAKAVEQRGPEQHEPIEHRWPTEHGPKQHEPMEQHEPVDRGPERRHGGLRVLAGVAEDTPLVLHQGAPAPDRGCEVLIAAIARLPEVHLAFLGDPEPGYGAVLRRTVQAHGVQDRVTLLPSVPLERLLAHTAEADVGVTLLQDTCENHRLALPNKLFEYVAARVPVVASALPETRALIERHRVGWCVTPGEPAALADTLKLALSRRGDPELRARLDRAAAELSWEREQQRLLGLYARLAADAPARAACEHPAGAYARATSDAPAPAAPDVPRSQAPVASATGDDEAVRAQERDLRQPAVQPAAHAAGQRGGERDRAHPQLSAQHRPQLAEPHQAGVPVGAPYARLPDRNHPSGGQHPADLAQRPTHILP